MNKKTAFLVFKYLILFIILVFLMFPLYWVLITSFKTNMEAYAYPPHFVPHQFSLESYRNLIVNNNEFFVYYKNNFIVSGISAVCTVFVALLTGYALSRFHFKWNKAFVAVFMSAQMFPMISRLISLYGFMRKIALLNTHAGLILAMSASMLPFSCLLMSSFFDNVPKALEEAGRIDGATRLQVLFKLITPLVKPGILAVGIYAFLLAWDDYLHAATLIQTDKLRTLSIGIALRYLGELSYDWSLINSISVIGILPMLLLFFFFQKHMVKGLVAGAVKG